MWQELDGLAPLVYDENDPSLDAASAAVRSVCGWHVAPEVSQTFVINEPGGAADIFLPSLRVTAVTACKVEGVALTAGELAALDWSGSGYLGRGNGRRWPSRRRSVEITVTHGWVETPADLAAVVLELAARVKAAPAGVAQESAGARSRTYVRSLLASDLAALAPYRIG